MANTPYRVILQNLAQGGTSGTGGTLSLGALSRHKDHISEAMAAAVEANHAEIVEHGGTLLEQLQRYQREAEGMLERAKGRDDIKNALAAIREACRCTEMLAKLQGELNEAPQFNVTVSPDWTRLRSVILAALAPFGDARAAVAQALLEHGE